MKRSTPFYEPRSRGRESAHFENELKSAPTNVGGYGSGTSSWVVAILLAVTVNVSAQDRAIRLAVEDATLFRFSVAGPSGEQALIEWSTNLTEWMAGSTFELEGSDVPLVFTQSPLPSQVFYRARRLAPGLIPNPANIPPCQVNGPPDQPSVRDAAKPNLSLPMKTLRLFIHAIANLV